MIKFKANFATSSVDSVEVDETQETKSTVKLLDGTSERKANKKWSYHDSWEAAHDSLVQSAKTEVKSLQQAGKEARQRLAEVSAMTKPVVRGRAKKSKKKV